MAYEGIINNPELETKIRDSLNYNGNNNTMRCYEASRKLSRQAPQFGYPEIAVRDGSALYSLDLLINLVSMKGVDEDRARKETISLINQTKSFQAFYIRMPSYLKEGPQRKEYVENIFKEFKDELPEKIVRSLKKRNDGLCHKFLD